MDMYAAVRIKTLIMVVLPIAHETLRCATAGACSYETRRDHAIELYSCSQSVSESVMKRTATQLSDTCRSYHHFCRRYFTQSIIIMNRHITTHCTAGCLRGEHHVVIYIPYR